MLKIARLSSDYGFGPVLDEIDLIVEKNQTFGLIGLNGAGKTTLIKTIIGLREIKSGKINFLNFGENTEPSQNIIKEQIAYLPERFNPPIFLSGKEFIKFSASFYKRSIDNDAVSKTAEKLGLDPAVLPRSVNSYSKGMRQKLGLIATIHTECQFLILDEPMSGLDPQARVYVKDTLNMLREQGRTIFLSSHILSDMHEICDKVAVLHNTKIQFNGAPNDMIKKYKTETLERAFLEIIETEKTAA